MYYQPDEQDGRSTMRWMVRATLLVVVCLASISAAPVVKG